MGVLSDFALMEVADPDSAWVGRSVGEIAEARGTDVVDVLIDVVLADGLTLFAVLPSLTPSLGRTDEGWAARTAVWKDRRVMLGGSDAGAHLDLMCHANYPTVVLGEVVRDRGLLTLEEAVEMMTDRPARLYGLAGGAGSPRAATPTWWCSTPPGWRADRWPWSTTFPVGASGSTPGRSGMDHVLVAGARWSGTARVTGRAARDGAAVGAGHRDGDPGRRSPVGAGQAVAAPSMTRVVPLMVAASSEAR